MPQSPNAQIVADFYAALSGADPDAVAAAIDAHFAEDAAIEWPPSLPHGGRIEGSRRLRGLFTGIAKAGDQAGATNRRRRPRGRLDHLRVEEPRLRRCRSQRRFGGVVVLRRTGARNPGVLLGHRGYQPAAERLTPQALRRSHDVP